MKVLFCLAIAAALLLASHARACTPQDEDRVSFSNWNYATPAADGMQFPYIAYEVKRTGFHTAEIHFKNFANKDVAFTFWLPGFQQAGRTTSVRVPISAPNDRQWVVPVNLDCGATGARFASLKMADIQIDGQEKKLAPATSSELKALSQKSSLPSDEAWLSIVPGQSLVEFGPETVACRVMHDPGNADAYRVVFKNTGRDNVFFDFIVKGYQTPEKTANPRVHLAVGEEFSAPVRLNNPDTLISLARVKAFNIRIHGDSGTFLDEKDAEEGWFAVSAVNCPFVNPNQIVYRVVSAEGSQLNIRFRNISRLPVSFKFGIAMRPINGDVAIGAEAETSVCAARIADNSAPASLTRIRVTNVKYGAFPSLSP